MPTDRLVAIWIRPEDRTRLRKEIEVREAETGRRNVTYGEIVMDMLNERAEHPADTP